MIIKDHTRIDLMEGGTRFKQGDYAELKFAARNSRGEVIDFTGKDIEASIWNRTKGVIFQSSANFESETKAVVLVIDEVLDYGDFQIEFTATDPTDVSYRVKFPSDEYSGFIKITPSTDNMDVVGVQMTTVTQLKAEQKAEQDAFEATIVPQVDELKQRVEDGVGAFTEDTEVLDARMGEPNLRSFNQKLTTQLAETGDKVFNAKAVSHSTRKAYMVFIDDDGRSDFYPKWKPILQQYNVKVVCALVTGKIGIDPKYMTWEQVLELKGLGVEFVSHTHNHPYLTQVPTEAELREEMYLPIQKLKQYGLNADYIVYPYGDTDLNVRKIVREYYKAGIDTLEGINLPPHDTFRMVRKGWFEGGRTTTQHHVDVVDEVYANKGVLIWKTHSQYPEFVDNQLATIGAVIDRARALGVEIAHLGEALATQANILDIGDLSADENVAVIDTNGNAHGRVIGSSMFVKHSALNGNINSDISIFKKSCRTTVQIDSADTTGLGLPRNVAGLVDVYRGATDFFGERELRQYKTGLKYLSYWDNTSKTWSPWQLANTVKYLGFNGMTPTTVPNDPLFRDLITITHIQSANAAGFPENSAGKLTMTALNSGNSYPEREYLVYGSNRIYRQYWNGTAWSSWQGFSPMIKMDAAVDFGTIQPGETKKVEVSWIGVKSADNLICNPSRAIDVQILTFGAIYADDIIEIKAYNSSAVAKTINRTFRLTVIKQ